MIKKTLFIISAALFCTVLCAKEFFLYKNGKAQADLLLTDISSFSQQEQKYIHSIVNYFHSSVRKCKLPEMKLIRKRSAAGKKNVLVLSPVNKPLEKMDEYVIDFPDRNTMRILCSYNSLKYALDDLLQNHFSVRFLLYSPPYLKAPKGYDRSMEYIYPALKEVKVPRKRVAEKSSFNLKRVFTGGHPREWKIRIGFFGGHGMTTDPFPARKYAADNSWPKEILPVHNGKKIRLPKLKKSDPKRLKNAYYARVGQYAAYRSHWQPCFSHPKTVTIAAENLIELLDKEPINPLYGTRRYNLNLDVNDCGGFCECDRCRTILDAQRKLGRSGYSEMYWKWVNDVARLVTKKYPEVYFNCLAYREVLAPPSFKMHKNVIVQVCKELNAGFSPEEKKRITALFKNWNAKASTLFLWDYCFGAGWYVFPRIFFNTHAEMLKIAYENNVRGVFCETSDRIQMCGPRIYLMAKTLWNVDTDVNAELKKWCIDAVGAKAAPELEQYYKFWENYWLRREMRLTNHFSTARSTYMNGGLGTYTYAIRKGELASLRKLLENVVKKAQTRDQKTRAKHILKVFAISEDAAKCLYSEYIEPNGYVKDAAAAAALLRAVPEGYKALERLKKNPLFATTRQLKVVSVGVSNLRPIEKFVSHREVRKALQEIAGNKTLPAEIRVQTKIMLGIPMKNLLKNGSFEVRRRAIVSPRRIYRGKYNSTIVSHGKLSFGGVNPLFRETQKEGLITGKKYMILVDVYAPRISTEGYVNLMTNPQTEDGLNTEYIRLTDLKLNKGWQTLSNTISLTGKRNGKDAKQICIQVWGENFEKDEEIYFDNIRIYQLN